MCLDLAADRRPRDLCDEQVELLYAQAPLGVVASLLIAPLLVLTLWNALPRTILIGWLLALEATVLIRLALIAAFRRRAVPDTAAGRWITRYTWACAASGVCWGGCVVLLAFSPSLVHDAFIALILGGVLMGGVFTMSSVLRAYVAYALPLGLPPVLWLLLRDDPIRVAMGVAGVLYLLLALATAQRFHRTLAHSLRLATENLNLAQSRARAKEQAEATNQRLADQQAALRDSVAAMRQLYEVISVPRRHARDRIQAMLAMGCQRFGLTIGILCHIDGERYQVVHVLAPGGEVAEGDTLALGDTYCQDTVRAQTAVGFEHASSGPWRQHPCYRKFGLEAYLGVPVRVSDQLYGTLNFSDFKPRTTPFTAADRELIQIMAQWVGGVLEQERMAEAARRQQALLAHASRLNTLGEMASSLVHEINQPVTAIALYAEAGLTRARNEALGVAEARDALEKIAAQGARAQAIIHRIRHFARQTKPQYTVVRLNDVFEDIADFLNLEARRHRIDLRYDIAPDLPRVLADALQVQQVILNLVRNAMDAMSAATEPEAGAVVAISARADSREVKIAVQDSGPGLAPDALACLPQLFFTTKPDGLGLGLSISQSIVEAHGGRLWATPNAGPGVTFHFTLPAAAVSTHAAEPLSLDAD
ncbi:MAG: ATP-binding protein [Candidatus Contendobacter sp.]|nr:ATP-binding protein [Candidatus Contendobacter sp.]MDG4556711.1 ATP-binding protein [Candidatus Contendobacter sp.]